ncbi:MAG: STT3 domain-containing protein [Nanoarchaeota archaeon]|mgnify:CR=1 FL=1
MSDKPDDEIEIDFSAITNIFKKKKKVHEHQSSEIEHKKENREEEQKIELSPKEHHTEHHEHKKIEHETKGHISHHHTEKEHNEDQKKHHEHKKHEDSDEISFDFSAIKNIFKSEKKTSHKEDDEIGLDLKSVTNFFSKKSWIITVLLAILVVWMSVDVRMDTMNLGFTDRFADESVRNYFRSQITQQVTSQNPNLPSQTRDQVIEQEYQKFFAANREQISTQVRATSLYFKTAWSDEKPGDCLQDFDWFRCNPYMPDIDPYYWLRYAKNIENHGYAGDEKKNGVDWDNHMLAPNGRPVTIPDLFHPQSIVFLHTILKLFKPDITIYQAEFFYPVIVTAFSTLFVFLIAYRIAGNFGGLFAGAMFAFSFAVLNRTLFGHGDSDAWVVFFPVLITWLYLEAFEARKLWLIIVASAAAGVAVGMYSIAWGGWWYIFDFILAMTGLYLIYQGISHFRELKKGLKSFMLVEPIRNGLVILGIFFLFSGIFVSLLNSFVTFSSVPLGSLGFTRIKDAVLPTLWPNVLTTVAELNEGNLGNVINSMGGPWMFWIGLLGIGFSMLLIKEGGKKTLSRSDLVFVALVIAWYSGLIVFRSNLGDTLFIVLLFIPVLYRAVSSIMERRSIDIGVAILLSIWFAGTTYASFKGIRFTLLLGSAYAVAFGVFFGILFTLLYKWLKENFNIKDWIPAVLVGLIAFAFFFVWFWPPGMLYLDGGSVAKAAYSIAENDVPIINDAWWKSLTKIKQESKPNAQINSWWDFGHHFKAIADRPVTFDGTTQDTPQAHWTGKNLLTSSEEENVGILRMLACGGNNAFETLNPINKGDTHTTIDTLYKIIIKNKAQAKSILKQEGLSDEQAESVLKYTHCEPPEMFYITSEDMIGKAGVWGHFGSWNFERAYIWFYLKDKALDEAVSYMTNNFNYTKKQSEDLYFEAQAITDQSEANAWVAPWPGYAGGGSCSVSEGKIICPVQLQQGIVTNFEINTSDYNGVITAPNGQNLIPDGVVYVKDQEVKTKKYNNPTFPYSFVLIPNGAAYNYILAAPSLASSIFTRTFYLKGVGLHYLRPFSHETSLIGTDIYVWKVDWDGGEPNKIEAPKTNTATIEYIGYFNNGTVFDSSIIDWRNKNVSSQTNLSGRNDTKTFSFKLGKSEVIAGMDAAVSKMIVNQTSFMEIPPELGYGTDPTQHPLGNITLNFKVLLLKVE